VENDSSSRPVVREVQLSHVHPAGAGKNRIAGRQVAAGKTGRQRLRRKVGGRERYRVEDPALHLRAQRRSGRLLDEQPERQVVAAAVRPALARRKEARLLQRAGEQVAGADLPAVRRVPAVGLEYGHDVVIERVREAARVVQKLPDGHAGHERRGASVERERALVHELEHDRRDEELAHAAHAAAVLRRQWPREAALHGGHQVTAERRHGNTHVATSLRCRLHEHPAMALM
jgi:hypothetical protein